MMSGGKNSLRFLAYFSFGNIFWKLLTHHAPMYEKCAADSFPWTLPDPLDCGFESLGICGLEKDCTYNYVPDKTATCDANERRVDCTTITVNEGRICVVRTTPKQKEHRFPLSRQHVHLINQPNC